MSNKKRVNKNNKPEDFLMRESSVLVPWSEPGYENYVMYRITGTNREKDKNVRRDNYRIVQCPDCGKWYDPRIWRRGPKLGKLTFHNCVVCRMNGIRRSEDTAG